MVVTAGRSFLSSLRGRVGLFVFDAVQTHSPTFVRFAALPAAAPQVAGAFTRSENPGADTPKVSEAACHIFQRLAALYPNIPGYRKEAHTSEIARQIQCFLDFGYTEESIRGAYSDIPGLSSIKPDAFEKKMTFYHENRLLHKGGRFRIHAGVLRLTTNSLVSRITFLKNLGLTSADITRAVRIAPALLTYSLQTRVPQFIESFRKFNLSAEDTINMLRKSPSIIGLSQATILSKVRLFQKLGFTMDQIGRLLRSYPSVLGYRVTEDGCIYDKMKFYFDFLSLDPEYLVRNPSLLCYSYQHRIKFRYAVTTFLGREFLPLVHVLAVDRVFSEKMGITEKILQELYSQYSINMPLKLPADAVISQPLRKSTPKRRTILTRREAQPTNNSS